MRQTTTHATKHDAAVAEVEDAMCKSGAPWKILKLAKSSFKYAIENALIFHMSEEKDIGRWRQQYEIIFGEPVCLFLNDRRIKLTMDVVKCAWEVHRKQSIVDFVEGLLRSTPSTHMRAITPTPWDSDRPVKAQDALGMLVQKHLDDTKSDISRQETEVAEMLSELKDLDPTLARAVARYTYGA